MVQVIPSLFQLWFATMNVLIGTKIKSFHNPEGFDWTSGRKTIIKSRGGGSLAGGGQLNPGWLC